MSHKTYSRLTVAVSVALVLSAVVPGVALAVGDDRLDVVRYGADQHPSAIVTVENGSMADLEDWAGASDDRTLVETNENANTAVVAAPIYTLRGSFFERLRNGGLDALDVEPLTARTYIEDVSLNYRLSNPEPVALDNASSFEEPALPGYMRLSRYGEEFPTEGLAFSEDAETSTLADARNAVNASSTYTGAGETVAVVDTGANTAEGEIFGNGSVGSEIRIHNESKNVITNESVNATAPDFDAIADGDGHGTWVASAIAANTSSDEFDGMAPDVELLVLKALDDDGSGSSADIAESIRYAADQDADVISASLGSPVYTEAIADAVEYAQNEGSLVLVAVGNSRQTTRWVATPADVDEVVGVGATTVDTPNNAKSAYFSQIGPDPGTTDNSKLESQGATVDVAAPGMKITARVATTDGYTQNATLSGTSMATPLVAGGAVSVVDAHAEESWPTVASRLRDGARPVPNASTTEVGDGMLDVTASIDGVDGGDQTAAMTDAAAERGALYRAMSDAEGGWFARLSLGVVAA